ncbi:MAG: hypothetical protein AB8G22_25235 [Saprospiraceae bacterium]
MIQSTAFDEIIEFFALLAPQRILAFHPSEVKQNEINALLDKKKTGQLSAEEITQLENYTVLEHIVRMAKARALQHAKL